MHKNPGRKIVNLHSGLERGNILVTTLLILLVMNLLGIGLVNLATKEWNMATYKNIDSEVFHITDSCLNDVMVWFATQTGTPASINNFSGEPTNSNNKLSGFSYGCTVTYIISKQAASTVASGTEIGNSGGSYNLSGNQVVKDYYQVNATGAGPRNATKAINSIISVEY